MIVAALGIIGATALIPLRAIASDPSTDDPVIIAVGDLACDPANPNWNGGAGTPTWCKQGATSNRALADASVDRFVPLGDIQYDCGDAADYEVSYDPTWGRLNSIAEPVVGNHEYKTGNDVFGTPCPADNTTAANYFSYFGAAAHPATAGHYSFDIGTWHIVVLNANCSKSGVGGCKTWSPQTKWLRQDLAATAQPCIAAAWHQPLWTGIQTGVNASVRAWWTALLAVHADVVLNGHIHDYQRFAPMDAYGNPTAAGLTEYIVGTGGEAQVARKAGLTPYAVAYAKTFGYLRMVLHPAGWSADFVRSDGTVLDSSSGVCH